MTCKDSQGAPFPARWSSHASRGGIALSITHGREPVDSKSHPSSRGRPLTTCAATQQQGRQQGRQQGQQQGAGGGVRRRGKALLTGGRLSPADVRDPLLQQIADELNPVETRMIQWFPGHIAKAERELREQLSAVDVVFEVRDGRIPLATRHPSIPAWAGGKPRLLIVNRADMVEPADRAAWSAFFASAGQEAHWTCGNAGDGAAALTARALQVSERLNAKRAARGLRPRPVRAVVVGYPNVGKSALINRLLGRRVADSAPKPGVTRQLRWARVGGDLDLLDAPGIIPMSLRDQAAAQRLAMCNDIGEAAYVASLVGAALLARLKALPRAARHVARVEQRYRMPPGSLAEGNEEEFVHALADRMFNGEPERAGQRILKDFRTLALGRICLEQPPAEWAGGPV